MSNEHMTLESKNIVMKMLTLSYFSQKIIKFLTRVSRSSFEPSHFEQTNQVFFCSDSSLPNINGCFNNCS